MGEALVPFNLLSFVVLVLVVVAFGGVGCIGEERLVSVHELQYWDSKGLSSQLSSLHTSSKLRVSHT